MAKNLLPPYYYQYRFIRDSCQNPRHPQYNKYGGIGITCTWGYRQYHEFYDWLVNTLGHRPGPSNQWVLGRKDKTGHWEPGNIEWQTIKVRSRTKNCQNICVKYKNKNQTLSKWAEDLGIAYHTLRRRHSQGWSLPKIVKEYAN
jgi:hypothetical protein